MFACTGCTGAYQWDHVFPILHRSPHGSSTTSHAGGWSWVWQNCADQRQTAIAWRGHDGDHDPLQLLYHVTHAAAGDGETTGEESWSKLWPTGNQETGVLHWWHEHACGRHIWNSAAPHTNTTTSRLQALVWPQQDDTKGGSKCPVCGLHEPHCW